VKIDSNLEYLLRIKNLKRKMIVTNKKSSLWI